MTLTDWIISLSAGFIVILLGVTSYFAQKWIQQVDETLKELSGDLKHLAAQVGILKSEQGLTAENISKTVQAHLQNSRFSHVQFDRIEKEVSLIKAVVQDKLLPHVEKVEANLGRVTVLETTAQEQEKKISAIFSAVKALATLQNQKRRV